MRSLFAFVIYAKTLPSQKSLYNVQPKPNGIANFIDLTFLANPEIYSVLEGIAIGCCILYALGLALWLVLPYLAFFSISTWTLANSQGGIGHVYQMVSLILLAQAVVAVVCAIRQIRRNGGITWFPDQETNTHLAYFAQVMIVGCYVTSGISKIKNSDGAWLWNSPYLVTGIVKAEHQSHFSRLHEPLDQESLSRAEWMVKHPMAARALFSPGLFLELAAFLALFGRRWALVIGLGLIGMHFMIEVIMSLRFVVFQLSVAVWLVNPGYWILALLGLIFRRKASQSSEPEI